MNPPRLRQRGHPDRLQSVRTVVSLDYEALVLRMMTHGIDERETAIVVEQLVHEHLDTMPPQDLSEWEIARADQLKKPQPTVYPLLPDPPRMYPSFLFGAAIMATGMILGALMVG